jgi:hypothetical protein
MDLSLRSLCKHDIAGRDGRLAHLRGVLRRALKRFGFRDPSPAQGAALAPVGEAAVLHFPIRGEALLARLAELLRDRLPSGAERGDPFLLTLSRGQRPRLSIDRAAYVEFHAEHASFHLIVDAGPDSRVTLETTDFDTLVKFVVQYLADGCRDREQFEAAS